MRILRDSPFSEVRLIKTRFATPLFFIVWLLAGYQGAFGLDFDYGKAKRFDTPLREISIIATKEGYYPKTVSIFVGEKVRFYITSTLEEPSCFMMPEKKLFLSAKKGTLSEGEAFFEKAGNYKFYCPTGRIKGRIAVLKKPNKKEKSKRELASEGTHKVRVWHPKDNY
jgi:hypothetical protein